MTPRQAPHRAPRVLLPDAATLADLRRFVARAARVDADGAARLVAQGDVLAMYVAPLYGSGGPTVLGLRVLRLARPGDADLTTPLTVLADRLDDVGTGAAPAASSDGGVGELLLDLRLPPAAPAAAGWAGVSPPRQGWQPVGMIETVDLRAAVAAGIAEVVAGTPPTAGGAQVAALRARVWGRPLAEQLPSVPSGVAFAADALAFLDDAEAAALYRCGPWHRLTTSRGHVLARAPMLAAR
jgi:hypothetical protein